MFKRKKKKEKSSVMFYCHLRSNYSELSVTAIIKESSFVETVLVFEKWMEDCKAKYSNEKGETFIIANCKIIR